ncbi:hypothetical protein GGI15_003165 [Coemansia interrupta]|uniref:CSD domain-containing protein n=1 Tax=Coemansia interrupta TaxID=1126814 RepID=A0A9W8HE58_9FUNG|nr:hypothetical protein GGI15_003165 [Coemansia interrupta]
MASPKTGRVKFFNTQKGYGFIVPNEPIDGNAEVFVHHTVIHNKSGFKSLAEGEAVEFEVARGPKGLQATRVTGPSGTYVRGEQYNRFQGRPAFAANISGIDGGAAGSGGSAMANPYYGYTHYPGMHPLAPPAAAASGYSPMMAYGGQLAQTPYGAYGYSGGQPTSMPFVISSAPQPQATQQQQQHQQQQQLAVSPGMASNGRGQMPVPAQYFGIGMLPALPAVYGYGQAVGGMVGSDPAHTNQYVHPSATYGGSSISRQTSGASLQLASTGSSTSTATNGTGGPRTGVPSPSGHKYLK